MRKMRVTEKPHSLYHFSVIILVLAVLSLAVVPSNVAAGSHVGEGSSDLSQDSPTWDRAFLMSTTAKAVAEDWYGALLAWLPPREAVAAPRAEPLAPTADPVAGDDTYGTAEDITLNVAAPGVLDNDDDVDGDALHVGSYDSTSANGGTVSMNADGSFSYTPPADFNGADSFTYEACDPGELCDGANVTVNVTPANDPPVAGDDTYGTAEDTTLNVAAPGVLDNDDDVDGDALHVGSYDSTSVNGGTVSMNANGSFSYTPPAEFNGADTFGYEACDPGGLCDGANVTVNVTPANDPPVAANNTYGTAEDTTLNVVAPGVLGNDDDVDGDALHVGSYDATSVNGGTVSMNANGSFSYTPPADFNGADSFTYEACDPGGLCDAATVTVNVTPLNDDPPVAGDDTYDTDEDTTLDVAAPGVLDNDNDVDGDALHVGSYDSTSANGGTILMSSDGSFSYTPLADFNGADTFGYEACDPGDLCDAATVTITVTPVNDAPFVDAGPDQTIALPDSAVLDGTVTDDGLPDPPGTTTATWRKDSGPGPVTFGDASAVDTEASFTKAGTYVLRLRAYDGESYATDYVTITVHPADLDYVLIRDASGGLGNEVITHTMKGGETFQVWAAGYDVYGNYIDDMTVTWSGTGVVSGWLSPTVGTSTTFTAEGPGTGTIHADHATAIDDDTGTITVYSPSLWLTMSNGKTSVEAGEVLEYVLAYHNAGNAEAHNTTVVVTPSQYVQDLYSVPSCDWHPQDGQLVCGIGLLSAGQSGTFTMVVTVQDTLPACATSFEASAVISTTTPGDPPAGNSVQDIDQIATRPDLVLRVDYDGIMPRPGKLVTYTVHYSNTGRIAASGVAIDAAKHPSTTFEGSVSDLCWVRQVDGSYSCQLGELDYNQSGTLSFAIRLPNTFTSAMIDFDASFTISDDGCSGEDGNPDDNDFPASLGVPDLEIEWVYPEPAVWRGEPGFLWAFVKNTGTGTACGVHNPSGCTPFALDLFLNPETPPASYPLEGYGDCFVFIDPIEPGLSFTAVISFTTQPGYNGPGFCEARVLTEMWAMVDNWDPKDLPGQAAFGWVPESDEENNVYGPVKPGHEVYLPIFVHND